MMELEKRKCAGCHEYFEVYRLQSFGQHNWCAPCFLAFKVPHPLKEIAPPDEAETPTPRELGAGDLESKEKGSGARFNAGKIPYEYLPLTTLLRFLEREKIHCIFEASPRILLEILAQWQRRDVDIDNVLCAAIAGYGLESFADAAHVFKHVTERPINPYPTWNFAKGMKWSIPFGCAVRHTLREIAGHTHDEETGLPERGHTLCNLIMLLHYQTHYPEGDDRAEAGLL